MHFSFMSVPDGPTPAEPAATPRAHREEEGPLTSDLRRCAAGKALYGLYRLAGRRLRPIGDAILAAALRLEGGTLHSHTARAILKDFHDTEVGAYLIGDCLSPRVLPSFVRVGRFVSMGEGLQILPRNRPASRLSTHAFFYDRRLGIVRQPVSPGPDLVIEHDVNIGRDVVITPSCRRIGLGAVVVDGSVVIHDVPDFAVVTGVPALATRYRFTPEMQERIRATRWWTLPIDRLLEDMPLFLQPLTDVCDTARETPTPHPGPRRAR